jgi:hypothetical protein
MKPTNRYNITGNNKPVNTGKIYCPPKPSLSFASFFLTIAALTCVGTAAMLWDAWNELRAHATSKAKTPEVQESVVKPSERLSAAALLAATIRNSSNGTAAPSHRQTNPGTTADERATAWIDSTTR